MRELKDLSEQGLQDRLGEFKKELLKQQERLRKKQAADIVIDKSLIPENLHSLLG